MSDAPTTGLERHYTRAWSDGLDGPTELDLIQAAANEAAASVAPASPDGIGGIDTASAEYHDGDLARSMGQPVESCPFPAQVVDKNAANWKAGWHGVCDEDLADTRHDNALTRSERLGGSL